MVPASGCNRVWNIIKQGMEKINSLINVTSSKRKSALSLLYSMQLTRSLCPRGKQGVPLWSPFFRFWILIWHTPSKLWWKKYWISWIGQNFVSLFWGTKLKISPEITQPLITRYKGFGKKIGTIFKCIHISQILFALGIYLKGESRYGDEWHFIYESIFATFITSIHIATIRSTEM